MPQEPESTHEWNKQEHGGWQLEYDSSCPAMSVVGTKVAVMVRVSVLAERSGWGGP